MKKYETRMCKMVFPNTLNSNETLFGGNVMKWMDEIAFITATRCTRQRMFTVKVENVKFLKTIKSNSIIEIVGTIEKIETAKLYVKIIVYSEDLYSSNYENAIESTFIFAALNEKNKPKKIVAHQNEN